MYTVYMLNGIAGQRLSIASIFGLQVSDDQHLETESKFNIHLTCTLYIYLYLELLFFCLEMQGLVWISKCCRNSEYDQEIPQSQTADKPMAR